jgi:transcriptional regulator with XRE-family HTH domain
MLHPNNVKKIRNEKRLSQEKVAEKLNMGLRAYQRIESGETKLDLERAQQLATVFNVSVLDLICNDNTINIENIQHNVIGFNNKEVTINQNSPINEIKKAYEIALQSKDALIAGQKLEIEFLKNQMLVLKKVNK